MRTSAALGGPVALLVLAATSTAGPPPNPVDVKDDEFKPRVSSQIVDSSTHWFWADAIDSQHNVREDSKLFYSGAPTDDPDTNYSQNLSAGTYHYYCEEHGSKNGGMDGEVMVRPQVHGPATADEIPLKWAEVPDPADRFDVRYRIGGGDWKSWLREVSGRELTFGASDDPVGVKPDKTYRFQARTLLDGTSKRSGWSPTTKVTTPP